MNVVVTIIKMLGGLVLLIYGMNILSTNLKKIAGERLKAVLKSATDSIFKGLITGIIVTVAVQSSAVVTVIVVGFVNAKILKIKNAIPIIMGANIGTTITAQILRLASLEGNSIFALLSPTVLASVFIIIGFLMLEFKKKQKTKDIGQLFVGIGLLFTGLMTMVNMASSFSNLPILGQILTKLSNPLLGVLAGALVTALVQSSAATIGILQAISGSGIITYASTIPIILGQNIGTCFTSLLSSIGTSKNAKRVAMIHLFFNLIGTIIFLIAIYSYQHFVGFDFWNKKVDMGGIANFHLIFNVVCTIILLPFIGLLEKLANLVVRDDKTIDEFEEDTSDDLEILNVLDDRITNIPNVAISNSAMVVTKMTELASKNFQNSSKLLEKFNSDKLERIQAREDAIDAMDVAVATYLVKIDNLDLTEKENKSVNTLLKIEYEFEKIGDYAFETAKLVESMNDKKLRLTDDAKKELNFIYKITEDILSKATESLKKRNLNYIIEVETLNKICEMYIEKFKKQHIERLKNAECSVDSGILFVDILTTYEKIAGHCVNITVEAVNYKTNEEYVTKHEYLEALHIKEEKKLKTKYKTLNAKYEVLLNPNKKVKKEH